ncbi:Transcriptional regulatory protein sin3 [Dissophora globulifera]|nr:Transcriptional regulatory protein sin3 [Dissophora globulifera]
MNTPRDSTTDQDEPSSSALFAHSLAVAPLDTANTIHNISLALNNGHHQHHNNTGDLASDATHGDVADVLMADVTSAVQSSMAAMEQQAQVQQQQPGESRMAVAELLVSLAQHSQGDEGPSQDGEVAAFVSAATGIVPTERASPIYRNAVDYVGSVKKAYENNPKVYTEFLSALEQYHGLSLPIDQLVRTVMTLFQDQPDLLLGFKEFLPEAQGLLNQLVPPMMYSDYKTSTGKAVAATTTTANSSIIPGTLLATTSTTSTTSTTTTRAGQQQQGNINQILNNGHAAADFLSLIKELSQQEPDMYQHMITLLRKFQKDHSYSNRFHNFLPSVSANVGVTEPRVISKAPPEELVVSPDFIEAKDFVQTVKYEAKSDLSMYDRFIFALEKYQMNGWTIDQVYSEVSLIFWNHPMALAGFKQFISSVPPPSQP